MWSDQWRRFSSFEMVFVPAEGMKRFEIFPYMFTINNKYMPSLDFFQILLTTVSLRKRRDTCAGADIPQELIGFRF